MGMHEPWHILIIEDDLSIQQLLQAVLEDEGYVVHAASNGVEALVMLGLGVFPWPALVMTDLRMPYLDGWCVARRMRDLWGEEVSVVVSTATGDEVPADVQDTVCAVVRKPFELDQLLDTLSEHRRDAPDPRPAALRRMKAMAAFA